MVKPMIFTHGFTNEIDHLNGFLYPMRMDDLLPGFQDQLNTVCPKRRAR